MLGEACAKRLEIMTISTPLAINWLACACLRAWKVTPRPMLFATSAHAAENSRGIAGAIELAKDQGIVEQLAKPERKSRLELLLAVIPQGDNNDIRKGDIAGSCP